VVDMAKTGKSKKTETPPITPVGSRSKKATAEGPATGRPKALAYKVTPAALQFILDMTVSGYSNSEILKALKSEMKITITEQTLVYHRNKNADKLNQSYEAELETAKARTNMMYLSRRIAVADELVQKEMRKKKPSLYGIATLLSAADTAIHRAEQRRMKYDEMARRYKEGDDGQKSEIMAALEQRTRLLEEVARVEEKMLAIVGGELEVIPPRRLESMKKASKAAPVQDDPELEEPSKEGLDENVLIVTG
jgi:hypothetical protein